MSRFIFAALGSIILAGQAASQQVPGRDLFEFPLGLLAEPAALGSQMAASLWNPAMGALAPPQHAAFGVAELYSPQEQGVRSSMIGGAWAFRPNLTGTASIASARVADLLRTETDPQSLGGEIPYSSTLLSLGVAGARHGVTLGLDGRYRWATSDDEHAGELSVDGGLFVARVLGTPIRFAASTFLFRPGNNNDASYQLAADVPLFTIDSTAAVKGGYAMNFMGVRGREDYGFAAGRYRQLDLSAGVARTHAYASSDLRWRVGAGLHYAGYTAAIGREDGAAGLGASFQILLTRVIK
ncbi:MAG: hypothetical protein ACREPM_14335 [Gemmatimonadaceae bacterium]